MEQKQIDTRAALRAQIMAEIQSGEASLIANDLVTRNAEESLKVAGEHSTLPEGYSVDQMCNDLDVALVMAQSRLACLVAETKEAIRTRLS